MFLLSHRTASLLSLLCRFPLSERERERRMELEINFNLNYKMRDGKILHKGLRFWGGRGRNRTETVSREKEEDEEVEKSGS